MLPRCAKICQNPEADGYDEIGVGPVVRGGLKGGAMLFQTYEGQGEVPRFSPWTTKMRLFPPWARVFATNRLPPGSESPVICMAAQDKQWMAKRKAAFTKRDLRDEYLGKQEVTGHTTASTCHQTEPLPASNTSSDARQIASKRDRSDIVVLIVVALERFQVE